MAEVLRDVVEEEHREYENWIANSRVRVRPHAWPEILWRAFSRPSGLAVLEILLAARSDVDLAKMVKALPHSPEELASSLMSSYYSAKSSRQSEDEIRLIVWAIRGLSIAQVLTTPPQTFQRTAALFGGILRAAQGAGVFRPQPAAPEEELQDASS